MATQPTNPISVIAEDDVSLPSTGQPNKVVPNSAILTKGYDDDQVVTAENLNYMFNNLGKWSEYFLERINELQQQIEKERVSVGEIIEITGVSTNPSILKGYGTWTSFGSGLVTVGVGNHTDSRGESKTWSDGQTEGEYKHVQTETEVGSHSHTASSDPHTHNLLGLTGGPFDLTDNLSGNKIAGESQGGNSYTNNGVGGQQLVENTAAQVTVDSSPAATAMNNTQPTIAVYRWKRTA